MPFPAIRLPISASQGAVSQSVAILCAPMVNRNGGNGVGSVTKSASGRPAKPRVLLAMGFQNPQRQAGIVRYARRAGWIVDSRLLAYHAQGQDREYLSNARVDGVLALCSRAAPWI